MNFASIFIVGFVVLGIYKAIELLVRRKERLMFIEKFFANCSNKEIQGTLNMPDVSFGKQSGKFGSLKIALLLIGVGIGCLMTLLTIMWWDFETQCNSNPEIRSLTYFSHISIFGGMGLLISYLIESKRSKNK
jgi:hypothetical protein